MDNNSAETARLLEQVRAGDQAAWNDALKRLKLILATMPGGLDNV